MKQQNNLFKILLAVRKKTGSTLLLVKPILVSYNISYSMLAEVCDGLFRLERCDNLVEEWLVLSLILLGEFEFADKHAFVRCVYEI